MMYAVRFYGPGDVRFECMPKPGAPGPGEVLLQILMVGLCGTDASHYLHPSRLPRRAGPLVLGHEVVGRVLAVGEGVTIPVGTRVVPGAGMWCGSCPSCAAGRSNICNDYYLYGIQEHGGLADYAVFPAKMCQIVPESCPNSAAVLAQPLAIALHALQRVTLLPGQTVAVFGVGGMGSLILAALSARMTESVCLLALDREPERLEAARRLSATCQVINTRGGDVNETIARLTNGCGVDVAIDVSGRSETPQQALSLVKNGGSLLLVGIPSQPSLLDLGEAVVREKNILTSNGQNGQGDLQEALHLLATSDLAARLSSHVISLDKVVEEGLLPLVAGRCNKKILVEIARDDAT